MDIYIHIICEYIYIYIHRLGSPRKESRLCILGLNKLTHMTRAMLNSLTMAVCRMETWETQYILGSRHWRC